MSHDMDLAAPPLDSHGRVWLKGMTRPRLCAWITHALGARETQAELVWRALQERWSADTLDQELSALARRHDSGL